MTAYHARDNTVQLIKESADILEIIGEHVALKKSGAGFKGLCPFHSEKTPSFQVNPHRQSFHCFGCNEGGDVFSFVMKFHRQTFPEAVKELAGRYNIALQEQPISPADTARAAKRTALFTVNEKASRAFHDQLLTAPAASEARKYLADRGIPPEVIETFQLGYAPDSWDFLTRQFTADKHCEPAEEAGLLVKKERGGHYDRFRRRIIFPIHGSSGKIVGFGGRILGDGQPKYLNSPESPVFDKSRTLFGLYITREAIRKARQCIVVEGNFDLLSLVVHDIRNVAAPLGTALSQHHIRSLKGYADEIILLFDGDSAGLAAALRSVPLFLVEQVTARIVVLPEEHDPDTYLQEYGREALLRLINEAQTLPEFVFAQLQNKYGMEIEGKGRIVSELQPLLKAFGNQDLQRSLFATHFSKKLGLPVEQLLSQGGRTAPNPSHNASQTGRAGVLPIKQRQLLNFVIISPEFLPRFLEAGIEDAIIDPAGAALLKRLKEETLKNSQPSLDRLLENMNDGPERTYVTRLLTSAPVQSDEIREAQAQEMLEWLHKIRVKGQREALRHQINEAQLANNVPRCLELMEKLQEIDKALTTP